MSEKPVLTDEMFIDLIADLQELRSTLAQFGDKWGKANDKYRATDEQQVAIEREMRRIESI